MKGYKTMSDDKVLVKLSTALRVLYVKHFEYFCRLLKQNKNLRESKHERQQIKNLLINEGYCYLNFICQEETIPRYAGENPEADEIVMQMAEILKIPDNPPNKKED